jgi:hypothetical protein
MYMEVRAHVLAHLPALATYAAAEVPVYEFVPEWLARRSRELGTYLQVPPLPASHPWRRSSPVPRPIHEAYAAEANGGWATNPVSWLSYPSYDPTLAQLRPEIPSQPSTNARPRTTGLGGTGRELPDSARPLGERGVTPVVEEPPTPAAHQAAPPTPEPAATPPDATPNATTRQRRHRSAETAAASRDRG